MALSERFEQIAGRYIGNSRAKELSDALDDAYGSGGDNDLSGRGQQLLGMLMGNVDSVDFKASADAAQTPTTARCEQLLIATFGANDAVEVLALFVSAFDLEPPVVTTQGGSTTFTFEGAAVVVDDGVTLEDPDSATLVSGYVEFSAGTYVEGEDVLDVTEDFGITKDWNSETGRLTLSGEADIEDWEALLQTVTAESVPVGEPDLTTRIVNFVVNDGNSDSNTATRELVMEEPAVPELTGSGWASTVPLHEATASTILSPGAPVDPGVTVDDLESPLLEARLVIDGYVSEAASGVIGVTLDGEAISDFIATDLPDATDCTGTWNDANGTFTISCVGGSTAQIQAALRRVIHQGPTSGSSGIISVFASNTIGESDPLSVPISYIAGTSCFYQEGANHHNGEAGQVDTGVVDVNTEFVQIFDGVALYDSFFGNTGLDVGEDDVVVVWQASSGAQWCMKLNGDKTNGDDTWDYALADAFGDLDMPGQLAGDPVFYLVIKA